jgi:dihydrofolate synthase/folylpolyglutamate synthase
MHTNPTIASLLESLRHPSLPVIDLSLARMEKLLAKLGNPERRLPPVIHLAGTNGKGSTMAFLRAICEAAGHRVHTYTSPHLVSFNERIVLAGAPISDDYLLQILTEIKCAVDGEPITFFEATTAAAFMTFAEHSADVLLLETGMGGRLDATNMVAKPLATLITPIGMDHMEFLGNSLAAIAAEKAGIMKRGVPCFLSPQPAEAREVFKRQARLLETPLHLHGRDWSFEPREDGSFTLFTGATRLDLPAPSLLGDFQIMNAALAATAAYSLLALRMTDDALAQGIRRAHWPARLQRLTQGPLVEWWGGRGHVILDGGHNLHAAAALAQWLGTRAQPATLLCAMMARKDARGFLATLAPHIHHCITAGIEDSDAMDAATLAAHAQAAGIGNVTPCERWQHRTQLEHLPDTGDLLITGSLYLAGEVLKNHS